MHHWGDTADDGIAIDTAAKKTASMFAPAKSPTESRALSSNNSHESPSSKESLPSLPNNFQLGTSLWLDLVCLMLPACCCFASPSQVWMVCFDWLLQQACACYHTEPGLLLLLSLTLLSLLDLPYYCHMSRLFCFMHSEPELYLRLYMYKTSNAPLAIFTVVALLPQVTLHLSILLLQGESLLHLLHHYVNEYKHNIINNINYKCSSNENSAS